MAFTIISTDQTSTVIAGTGDDISITPDAGDTGVYAGIGAGVVTLTNTGTITGALYALQLSDADDAVTNHGRFFGGVQLGDGLDILLNTDLIDGPIEFGSGVDTFTNSGHVEGDIDLLDGGDSSTGKAADRIRDFEIGTDLIDFGGLTAGTFTFIGTGAEIRTTVK